MLTLQRPFRSIQPIFASKELEKADHASIGQLVNSVLRRLCETEEEISQRFLLFLSDSAAYMKKSGRALKVFYPNLIHVTCLAHALHIIANEIREDSEDLNNLVAFGKQILLKAPNRIKQFKDLHPEIELPPKPIFTRWGTWIEAINYYSSNYEIFKSFVENLNPEDSTAIRNCQKLLAKTTLSGEIAFVSANYSFLVAYIKALESKTISLAEGINLIENTTSKLMDVEGPKAEKYLKKFIEVIMKNGGLFQMKGIERILRGKENSGINEIVPAVPTHPPEVLASFKFAPITSVEVERSFSRFKNVLTENRSNLTKENLEMILVCNCYFNDS